MAQNLRVDIIYHMSPSDFEMEFNLSGCCRMRLLSDKTTDKKGFVKKVSVSENKESKKVIKNPIREIDNAAKSSKNQFLFLR